MYDTKGSERESVVHLLTLLFRSHGKQKAESVQCKQKWLFPTVFLNNNGRGAPFAKPFAQSISLYLQTGLRGRNNV